MGKEVFLRKRHDIQHGEMLLFVAFVIATTIFGLPSETMFNYGYNYYQFLNPLWLLLPVCACFAICWLYKKNSDGYSRTARISFALAVFLMPILFWMLRTNVHVFGGDGAIGHVPHGGFLPSDWMPPLPGKGRLDGFGSFFVAKICLKLGLFQRTAAMPSIVSTAVYSCIVGTLFAALSWFGMRRCPGLFAMLITAPFVFNFFGNIDSYSFSLLVGLVFLLCCLPFARGKNVEFRHLVGLGVLWGIGLWTHPFHTFEGFVIAVLFSQWLKRKWHRFAAVSDSTLSIAFGIVFFSAVKMSQYGNTWFEWAFAKPPPTFSIDTLTHYLNMLFLPSLPWIAAAFFNRGKDGSFKTALWLYISASAVFFSMAFTLGTVDQFNYQHLLFFFLMPWILLCAKHPLPPQSAFSVLLCNLCLLVPMIAVHSSDRTIARAEALYPIDPCHHNRCMSWQTHLGLALGDNLQENPAVKCACLRTFSNGARHANPPRFRGGNYIYHTAFLYHFGEFTQGRRQLETLLSNNPNLVGYFLNERPAFIYCNRKRLWDDIEAIVKLHHPQFLPEVVKALDLARSKAIDQPYYLKRPNYATTEY